MNTPLQKAAQAMIDRWESTDWKDTPHTAHYIEELRKALDAELAQSVEPVAWVHQFAGKGTSVLSYTKTCAGFPPRDDAIQITPLYLHPPQPQATTPVPEGYVLVPIEATPAMDNAYRKSPCRDLSGLWHEIITAAAQGANR